MPKGSKGHHLIRPASDRQARWLGRIAGGQKKVKGISRSKAKNVLRGYHYSKGGSPRSH